jgi:glucose-6-phosphate 1-dehydrogenase
MADTERHPFLQGLSKHRGAPPTVVVIFGASGDLTARKLIPAVYNLGVDNLLPADFYLVGFGRKKIPDDDFRKLAADAIKEFSRRELKKDVWGRIAANTSYVAGEYDDKAAFKHLAQHIAAIEKKTGREVQTLFYISTPPSVFEPILLNLGKAGLAGKYAGQAHQAKVIIEKPFGRDLASALQLNATIRRVFEEHQVYRIDHYLGKETVQDLLVQRFSNSIFEPLWNRNYIDSVQITVAEEVGVGTRGGYYEQSGCLRDMIQNHTMQLLALTAMEPPVAYEAEAMRDEKVKVLKAIQPLNLGPGGDVARAQYTAGMMGGKAVPGYLQEEGIAPDSKTETYAAVRLWINNWRWQGVPRVGDRDQFQAGAGHAVCRRQPFQPRREHAVVPNSARRGTQPDPQHEDPRPRDAHAAGEDEFPLRHDVRLEHARGLRAARARCDGGRRHAVHPRRRGRDLVETLHAGARGVGRGRAAGSR